MELALRALFDEQEPGQVLARLHALLDHGGRGDAVGRIVGGVELAQHDAAAVVHDDRQRLAFLVVRGDLALERHEISVHRRLVVLARVGVALGRALVIVEGHAG